MGVNSVTVSYLTHYYYKMGQLFYHNMWHTFITKCDRSLLQNISVFFIKKCDSFITNCDDFITKCNVYLKLRQYTGCWPLLSL